MRFSVGLAGVEEVLSYLVEPSTYMLVIFDCPRVFLGVACVNVYQELSTGRICRFDSTSTTSNITRDLFVR
jgi:hypothetical protein